MEVLSGDIYKLATIWCSYLPVFLALATRMHVHSCDVLSFAKHISFCAVLWVVLAHSSSALAMYVLPSCVQICAGSTMHALVYWHCACMSSFSVK